MESGISQAYARTKRYSVDLTCWGYHLLLATKFSVVELLLIRGPLWSWMLQPSCC